MCFLVCGELMTKNQEQKKHDKLTEQNKWN